MESDRGSTTTSQVGANPKVVSFAQPIVDYREDVDDLVDFSSSSQDSDDDAPFGSGIYTQQGPRELERGRCGSTYLERLDYKALLQSLRAIEQHDTAHHLMCVAMLRTLPQPEARRITLKGLRRGWSAWPLPPAQTRHSRQAHRKLDAQLQVTLCRQMGRRLTGAGMNVSSDELPDDVCRTASETILDKVSTLLETLGRARAGQGGEAKSSSKRLRPMTSTDVLNLLAHSDLLSVASLERLEARAGTFSGTAPEGVKINYSDFLDRTDESDSGPELSVGQGRWHLRGSKRRRIVLDQTSTEVYKAQGASTTLAGEASTDYPGNAEARPHHGAYTILRDVGTRYTSDIQPVPRRFIKEEQG